MIRRNAMPLRIAALIAAAFAASTQSATARGNDLVHFDHFSPHEIRSARISVSEPTSIHIDATGADEHYPNNTLVTFVGGKLSQDGDREFGWRGNAWILDATTREPVWELQHADTERESKGLRSYHGDVRLKPGTYEVYFSSYSAYRTENFTSNGKPTSETRYYDDGISRNFELALRGDARVAPNTTSRIAAPDEIASLIGITPGESRSVGLTFDRPTRVRLYVEGEARTDGEFDYGVIMNADTHTKVWSFDYDNTDPAGGASKNRMARETITLPAGRYAAIYTMDDTHDPSDWNQSPPLDPVMWGMTVSLVDPADRAQVHTFEYSPIPANALVSINRVGNNEMRNQGFTLDKSMDVRIVAMGEGSSSDMDDYGWITDARTHHRVWSMTYDNTQHAGGDAKNRIATTTVRLDPGTYMVNYRSDSSHSFDDWNAGPPIDGELWGITVSAADAADRSAAKPYEAPAEDEALAQIVKVGDDVKARKTFTMPSDGDVRVYAIGEGTSGSMDDYGWIEERATGRVVWEMTYRMTEHAGGASKNRMYDDKVHLPAGDYVLHYESDDSHSYHDWNDDAPDDPAHWGITVYRPKH